MDTFNYEFNKLRAGSLFKYNNEYFLVLGYDSKYIQEDLSIICISSGSKYPKTFMDFNIMNVSRIFVFDNTVGLYNGFLYKNLTIDYNFFSLDTMNNYLLKLKMLGNDYVTSIIKTLEMKMYIVNTFHKDMIYLDIFKIIPFTDFSGTFYRYKGKHIFCNLLPYSIIEEPNKERNLLDYLSIDIKDIRLVEYTEIEYKKYLGI